MIDISNWRFYFYIIIIGWKDSILSLPKKWLSTSEDTDEYGFPLVSITILFYIIFIVIKKYKLLWVTKVKKAHDFLLKIKVTPQEFIFLIIYSTIFK